MIGPLDIWFIIIYFGLCFT